MASASMQAKPVPDGLAACRALLGGVEADPLALSWAEMQVNEREFWLGVSRLSKGRAVLRWRDIPQSERATLKNNLFRAARRAELILSGALCAN